jgi:hypothetical protein
MLPNCQKVEIKKMPHTHLATDITNFTSAVCAVFINSTEFQAIYTTVEDNSANWYQNLTYNPSNFRLSISNGNSVSLSSLVISSGSIDAIITGIVFSNSGYWDSTYNVVSYNSGYWDNTYSVVKDLSSTWNTVTNNSSLIIPTNISNGVVFKTYDSTVKPLNMVLLSAITDTTPTNLSIHWDGPVDKWMGQPFVNGNAVPLSSIDYLGTTSFTRRFSATIPVLLQTGINIIPLKLENYEKNLRIDLLGAGPQITNVTFGLYPGTQTELKNGDSISMTVEFDSDDAAEIQTFASNNIYASTSQNYSITTVSNSATINITIATTTNSLLTLPVRLRAKNSFGTYGDYVISSETLFVNNVSPTFGAFSVTYPNTQTALKGTENATVSLTVSNQGNDPIYFYSSPNNNLTIIDSSTYNSYKSATCNNPGTYNVAGDGGVTNYRLTVTRKENNKSATSDNIVDIADIPATITVSEPSSRLRSGGTNGTSSQQYTITITSNQRLLNAPSLTESVGGGTLISSWTYSTNAKTFTNTLQVQDTDNKGTFNWNNLVATNKANTVTSVINGNSNYVLGGYVIRTLTFSSLSRTVGIGTRVADSSKVTGDESFRGTVTLSAIPNGTILNPDINTGINIPSRFTIVSLSSLNVVNNNGDAIFYLDRVAVNQNIGGTASFLTQETI